MTGPEHRLQASGYAPPPHRHCGYVPAHPPAAFGLHCKHPECHKHCQVKRCFFSGSIPSGDFQNLSGSSTPFYSRNLENLSALSM